MKQLTNGVSFKSIPSMWEIEENGLKPNTIRTITGDEYEWVKGLNLFIPVCDEHADRIMGR